MSNRFGLFAITVIAGPRLLAAAQPDSSTPLMKKGHVEGGVLEVMGALQVGDKVVMRATDEIRDGSPL